MASTLVDNTYMKVLNLLCANAHPFEGWFSNEEEYQSQHARGLVSCPVCNDKQITKALTAPRLNLKSGKEQSTPTTAQNTDIGSVSPSGDVRRDMLRAWLDISRTLMSASEDVGPRFAEEVRRIHYGEVEGRNIRGKATPQEFHELLDEGVDVLPLLIPDAVKGPLQ